VNTYRGVLRWGIAVGVLALASEMFAFALLTWGSFASNSHLWFPVNACYFGGIVLAFFAGLLGFFGLAHSGRTLHIVLPFALAASAAIVFRLTPYR
jgi:hypothetical protein